MLKLSPEQSNMPYIAAFYAVTGLSYAANTVLGGVLLDRFADATWILPGGHVLDYYQAIFLAGWIARSLGLVVLLMVVEKSGQYAARGAT